MAGIAQRIVARDEVSSLDDRVIIEIPISELIAGTNVRGSLAERVAAIRNEVREAMGRVVLFFDEIHTLFGGDSVEEVESELKLALARGELPCIGTTTPDEYKRAFESDPALGRRFSVVEVEEPDHDVAREILDGVSKGLAQHHGVSYAADALAIHHVVGALPARPCASGQGTFDSRPCRGACQAPLDTRRDFARDCRSGGRARRHSGGAFARNRRRSACSRSNRSWPSVWSGIAPDSRAWPISCDATRRASTPAGPSARFFFSARPVSARPNLPRPSPTRSFTPRRR